jgi:tetratricopeptide (TPR) repeat protein
MSQSERKGCGFASRGRLDCPFFTQRLSRFIPVVVLAGLLAPWAQAVGAAECAPVVGRLVSVEGDVQLLRGATWRKATLNEPLCKEDNVSAGPRSRAAIALVNEAVLRLDESTTLKLLDVAQAEEKRSFLDLLRGAIQSFSRKPRLISVNTPYLNGSIEGTEFLVRAEAEQSTLTVFEGRVRAENPQGSVAVSTGEEAVAMAGKAPQVRTLVRPRDAVQWSLYYPPVLAVLGGGGSATIPAGASPALRDALEAAGRGETMTALAILERVPEADRDAQYFLYQGAILLSVGRVGEAQAAIDRALGKDPNAGLAYALRSIIEVVQNDRNAALADAERAVALSPTAAAKIALSYALQATFQIEAARDTIRSAVEQHPDDPLALARLAELELMRGAPAEALANARKAKSMAPGLSRAELALGFSALASLHFDEATAAFERAIALDSADPLAHLGLGLATIRGGKLAEGRGDLEAAVALDSSSALLRAYLGKAYFEEKRGPLDAGQYNIAKQLDPKDPTAYFYDAIQKQTTNRPVEALQDMQKAIELNDNRAVYRSRLLLDSDLAARSASQARIYTDLGFQQLGLVEGWKSVNTDPSNFSAHRLLADLYSVRPRHEIARVSELLQSQLLQPLNMTPIQPRLAESNLFLISAQGPAALSFNEFNPIFNRDGVTVQASGLVGENSTYAGEGVVSGIYKKASLSVGGSHFTTDGFRKNADQTDDIANAFVQYEISPKTSVQAEYRYRNTEFGDLQQRFFPQDVFLGLTQKRERHSYRFGGRYNFSTSSTLLGSFIYQDAEESVRDEPPPFPGFRFIDLRVPQDIFNAELQHLFRSRYFNLTSGVGYVDVNGNLESLVGLDLPPPPLGPGPIDIADTISADTQHVNGYVYANVNALRSMTLTIGGSFDSLSGDTDIIPGGGKDQFNPKFGISWDPLPGTTLRGAVFRVLKKTLATDQTLEPTQIAGFNQFFDDTSSTDAWRYGVAVDQTFTSTISSSKFANLATPSARR